MSSGSASRLFFSPVLIGFCSSFFFVVVFFFSVCVFILMLWTNGENVVFVLWPMPLWRQDNHPLSATRCGWCAARADPPRFSYPVRHHGLSLSLSLRWASPLDLRRSLRRYGETLATVVRLIAHRFGRFVRAAVGHERPTNATPIAAVLHRRFTSPAGASHRHRHLSVHRRRRGEPDQVSLLW